MEENFLEIIKLMNEKKWMNKGLPIVAVVFDSNLKIIEIQSNKPKNDNHWHAELLCLNNLSEKKINGMNINNLNLMITTTPCNDCTEKIINDFDFKNIYYLFYKNNKKSKWKKIRPELKKYIPESIEEKLDIKIMKRNWKKSNKDSDKKRRKKIS